MSSSFLPKCKPKSTRIFALPNKRGRSTFIGDFLVNVGSFFAYDPCLFGRVEILVISGLHFEKNDDLVKHSEFN